MQKRMIMLAVCLTAAASGCRTTEDEQDKTSPADDVIAATTETEDVGLGLHSWGNYHWARTGVQFTLKVGNNLTSTDWKNHLAATSADWNNPTAFGAVSTPLIIYVVAGLGTTKCRMVLGTTQVCNGKYGRNGWLGLASINISGNHITQGTAKMNDTYFNMTAYNNPNERRHVMCQEIAHTFGLDHQSEDGSSQNSCMDYFSNTGANTGSTQSIQPNAHDFEQLNIIYGHTDTTTTIASTPASTTSDTSDDLSKSWGALKHQSKDGHSSWYENKNKDGSITLTHVYWADEHVVKCPTCDHR